MNRQDLIFCSEDDLSRLLLPIDDELKREGVPHDVRAVKGWHIFMSAEHMEDVPLLDPASKRVLTWSRTHEH